MDSFKHTHPLTTCFSGILSLFFLLAAGLHAESRKSDDPYAPWDGMLTAPAVSPFVQIVPFDAEYGFGWQGIGAGNAKVHVTEVGGGRRAIAVRGGPNCLIRKLWNYEVIYTGESGGNGELPTWFRMDENYPKLGLRSEAYFKEGSMIVSHHKENESKPWETIDLPKVHDLFSAILFVRSQPLHDGDKLRVVIFPNRDPFLVDLIVAGRETITLQGKKIHAIRFNLKIETIEAYGSHKGCLAPYKKFHSGRVWMSDDERRLPLRAEVDIFIGRVFAELLKVTPSLQQKTPDP